MEMQQLVSALEAILFAAEKPVSLERLKETFGETIAEAWLLEGLQELKAKYQAPNFGVEIREAQGGFHFCTKPENVEYVRKFLAMKPFRLGRSALETLSIIAYRQPISRAEIDRVRGIDSSHLLRTLIERGLVRMAGKADAPGRPVQYATTPRFLEVVGLSALSDLPPLSELDSLQGDTKEPSKSLEDGLEKFLRDDTARADSVEDSEGYRDIDALIDSVERPDREVYESALHAEVGEENVRAAEAFQEFSRGLKRWWRSREKAVAAGKSPEPFIIHPLNGLTEPVSTPEVFEAPAETEAVPELPIVQIPAESLEERLPDSPVIDS